VPDLKTDRLWQGVSSQPPWLRLPGQVKSALNLRHDVSLSGAAKRAATLYKADLSELTPSKDYIFVPLRDAIIAIGEDEVFAWDTNGVALTVDDDSPTPPFNEYLRLRSPATGETFDPFLHLDFCSSQDTLVIVNRTINTAINIGWTFQQIDNFLLNGDITVETHPIDDSGPAVDTFSDLPNSPSDGDIVRVRFDEDLDPHGYYLRETGTPHDDGVLIYPEHGSNWFRIPKASQSRARMDNDDMPQRILREDDTTLSFNRIVWSQRLNGNPGSNPPMPWRNKPLQACSFQHGRLFLWSKFHTTASRTNDPFDFWDNNAGTPVDSDPIAQDINDANIGNVLRVGICGENVLINCENGQVQYGSGVDVLTKTNGRHFRVKSLKPEDIPFGVSDERLSMIDRSGHVHQFLWAGADAGGIRYAGWMNSHAQFMFRGKTPLRLFSMPNQSFYTTVDDRTILHDHFILAADQIQSAWGELEFQGDAVFFNEWHDLIRIITHDATGYSLVHHVHRDPDPVGALEFEPHSDRQEQVSGTYDAVLDQTKFTHTGRSGDLLSSILTLATDVADVGRDHQFLEPVDVDTAGKVSFQGNITGAHWLGFRYTTQIETSKLFLGIHGQDSKVKIFTVFHYLSSGYEALVNDREGNVRRTDASTLRDTDVINTFFKRFSGLPHDAKRESVALRSTSPGPLIWTMINFDVDVEGNP
jgi:hypothetical protein